VNGDVTDGYFEQFDNVGDGQAEQVKQLGSIDAIRRDLTEQLLNCFRASDWER
jgi:hypothetical protein